MPVNSFINTIDTIYKNTADPLFLAAKNRLAPVYFLFAPFDDFF